MYSSSQRELESLINEGYTVKIGEYIGRGWEILKQNLGGFIGFLVVVFLLNLVLGFIPPLGTIASIVIVGPLNAGFFLVAFKIVKDQKTTFSDFFRGLNYFTPVFLASWLMTIFAATLFLLATWLLSIFKVFGFIIVITVVAELYLAVSYTFTIPLILEKRMNFWVAMETSRKVITKNWFSMFFFVLVLGLLNLGGVLMLGLGVLLTVPLSGCAIAAAYEDIVGLRIPSSSTEDYLSTD